MLHYQDNLTWRQKEKHLKYNIYVHYLKPEHAFAVCFEYAEIMSIVLLTYYTGKMSTYVEKIGVHIDQYSNFNEFSKSPVDKWSTPDK